MIEHPLSCGDVSFDLYFYYKTATSWKKGIGIDILKKDLRKINLMLEEYGGIKLYRDKFRVKPYAGVSTAVLFFTKGEPTQNVWFYKMESDGFSLDDKRTFIDGKGDISDILEHFDNREKEKPTDRKKKYFLVPIKEIKEKDWDLSISKYREIEYEEIEYEKPEVLKKRIIKLEEDILKGLKELEA
ncbi:MAG: SAM-dependent methyltransferase [Nanoarchaeota archaeon]|nr:SAM-dependent methyltransferase [Nanoarchaeota archaeon]MBU1027851.1 SAM-dependent methyltransferase [Nanoarchaeota archaeon]